MATKKKTTNTKKTPKLKTQLVSNKNEKILLCEACGKYKPSKEFYRSYNPNHDTGFVPYCKPCIRSMCSDINDLPDKQRLIKLLKKLDRPFINEYWEKALTVTTGNVIGNYFSKITTLQKAMLTWEDSDFDKLNDTDPVLLTTVDNSAKPVETTFEKRDKFNVTDDIIELFGQGFTEEEYFRMNEKYNFLLASYKQSTNMHTEALVTYVRYKVKEEIAIANNKPNDAKTWGELAMKQAEKAKINPNQFSKSDLQGGVSTIGEIAKAVEEHQDIIKILPQFRYRPNDAVDFCIWNYINYIRELEGKPLVEYKDIYEFYDKKKQEYIDSTGDPYGIFDGDPTEENREKVKTFIDLPEDYNDEESDE